MELNFIQRDNIPYIVYNDFMAKLVKLDLGKYEDLKSKNRLQGQQVPGYSIFFIPEYQWPAGVLSEAAECYLKTKIEKKPKYFKDYKLPVGA